MHPELNVGGMLDYEEEQRLWRRIGVTFPDDHVHIVDFMASEAWKQDTWWHRGWCCMDVSEWFNNVKADDDVTSPDSSVASSTTLGDASSFARYLDSCEMP